MIFPFNQDEFVIYIKDIKRCPYLPGKDYQYDAWYIADNHRKLLIALDRYANSLTCQHETVRIDSDFGVFQKCIKCERYVHVK